MVFEQHNMLLRKQMEQNFKTPIDEADDEIAWRVSTRGVDQYARI